MTVRLLSAVIALQIILIAALAYISWQGHRDLTQAIQASNNTARQLSETQQDLQRIKADADSAACFANWIALNQTESGRAIYPSHCERQ